MLSDISNILSTKYNEELTNIEIEKYYKEIGLNKPKLLVFDNIQACKLAYKFLLVHLNNYSRNLSDEHIVIRNRKHNLHDFYNLQRRRIDKDDLVYSDVFNVIRYIEEYYEKYNMLSFLVDVKEQILKDFKPAHIPNEKWQYASEETRNIQREIVWNNITNSNANLSTYKFGDYINYIPIDGIFFGIFFKEYCILCKNPIKFISEDKNGKVHSIIGNAIEFNDNNGINFVHGIKFTPELFSKAFIKNDIIGEDLVKLDNNEKIKILIQYCNHDKLCIGINGKELIKLEDFEKFNLLYPLVDKNKLINEIVMKEVIRIKNINILKVIIELIGDEKIRNELTGKEIIKIKNVELRAVLIQSFGYDNLVKELDAKLIDAKDEFNKLDNTPISYELWEFEMDVGRRGRDPRLSKFRFVRVEDYSTHKKVCLGVPISEETNNCIGAIAWTFGMTAEEYKPEVQT